MADVTKIALPGPVKIYQAPYSDSALETAPADTVDYGTAWGDTWVDMGYTKGGALFKAATESFNVVADQANAPITSGITGQSGMIEFTLLESTLAHMKIALGYGTVTAAANEDKIGVSGTDVFPTYITLGLEALAQGSKAGTNKYNRLILHKVKPVGEVEIGFTKEEERVIKFEGEVFYEAQATASERLYAHYIED